MSEERYQELDDVISEVRLLLTDTHDAADFNELVVLQMLLQITKELHDIRNVHELVTRVLDSAIAFTNSERAFLMTIDGDQPPRFKMGRSREGTYLALEDFSPSQTIIDKTIAEQKTITIDDALHDEITQNADSIQSMSLRTIMCSPLMKKKEIIGLLYVDSSKNPIKEFSHRSYINFLTSLAEQAAVAVRNAQKFETLVD